MKRIGRIFRNLVEYSPHLSVILAVLGILPLVFFLRNVDAGASVALLFGGAILLALSNLLAFLTVDRHKIHFLFVLFVTTFFLITMYDIRFGVLQGSDIVWEYTSARITLNENAWLLSRASLGDRYFTAASISLFPAVVSKVTGLDLMPIFQWILRAVLAILPLAIFQTVQEIFGEIKLSALSALIFAQFYFNFNLLNFLIRQGVAELFLVLTIFSLVKLSRAKSKRLAYASLVAISFFGLVIGHYTLNYWSILMICGIFLLCFIIGYLPKKLLSLLKLSNLRTEKPIIDSVFLVFYIAVSSAWIYFTSFVPFLIDIHNELYLFMDSNGAANVSSNVAQTSWFLNNPAGPVVGFWLDFTLVLIPLGFLYVIFKVRKRSINMPWIGGGLVMLVVLGFWVMAGSRMLGLYVDRIIVIGAIFFTTFMAICVLLVNKKLRIFAIVFLLINLPLNMLVPSYQRYVLYRPEESVPASIAIIQRIIRVPEFTASVWLDQNAINNSTFQTDFLNEWFYAYFNVTIVYSETPPINNTGTYFLLDYYNLRYGMWQGPVSILNFSVSDSLSNSCIVYSNGDAAIIARLDR